MTGGFLIIKPSKLGTSLLKMSIEPRNAHSVPEAFYDFKISFKWVTFKRYYHPNCLVTEMPNVSASST